MLLELVKFMYENQFGVAGSITGSELPLLYVYGADPGAEASKFSLRNTARKIVRHENTITQNETREENEKEKNIKHSAFAVYGTYARTGNGICGDKRLLLR